MSQYDLIPVDEAMKIVASVVHPLPAERVRTDEADVRSPENVPPFRASTVDGFAVIAGDSAPRRQVIREITAGVVDAPRVEAGTAARIMTGAPLPDGADAVVMIEYTRMEDGHVILDRPVRSDENIRP